MKINIKIYLKGRLVRNSHNGVLFCEDARGYRRILIDPANAPKRWSLSPLPPSPRSNDYEGCRKWEEELMPSWKEKTILEALYQAEMERILETEKTEPYFFERLTCAYQGRIYQIDADSADGLDSSHDAQRFAETVPRRDSLQGISEDEALARWRALPEVRQ